MKFFLLTVFCVAAAVAGPSGIQKREVLPGDPRYGTDYHQHHHHHQSENEVPQNSYGPPQYQPPAPINNGYLTPNTEVTKQSVPVPSYGVPASTGHVPQKVKTPSKSYLEPVVQEAQRTQVPAATYGVPVQKAPVHVEHKTPFTSYGSPVVADVKTPVHTVYHDAKHESSHVTPEVRKPVVPHVQVQQHHVEHVKHVAHPEVKVAQHVPVSQGVFQHTVTKVQDIPSSVGVSHQGFGGSFDTGSIGTFGSSNGGYSDLSSFDTSSYQTSLPSSLYSSQSTFGSGFGGYDSSFNFGGFNSVPAPQVHFPQNYPVHVPFAVPVTHTVEVPKPYFIRVPQQVQHIPHIQPVQHVPHIQPVQHVPHIQPVQHVPHIQPVQHVPHIQPVQHVPHIQPVQHIPQVRPVQHIPQVRPAQHIQPQHSVHHSVAADIPQSIPYSAPQVVEHKTPVVQHHHVEIQKSKPIAEYVQQSYGPPGYQQASENFQVPSFEAATFAKPTTEATIEVPAPVHVSSSIEHESVTIDNPVLKTDNHPTFSHVVPVKTTQEYVQPTDSNGGYVY